MTMETIYNLLNANKRVALSLYEKLRKLKGFSCIVREPIEHTSIFGQEDLIEYDELGSTRKQLLVYGLFQEGYDGGEGYDAFIDGCYVLTTEKEKLEQGTQVVVEFCKRSFTFKVDRHMNVLPSTCGHLFIKNILVPAT